MDNRITSLKFGRRELLLTLLGIVLYAGTSWVTNFSVLSEGDASGVIRPGVAIPIFFGFAFGPIIGFLVGALGNLSLDFIVGWAFIPTDWASLSNIASNLSLNWEVGNGLMGLVPGLFSLRYRRFLTTKDMVRALAVILLAVVVGIGFAAGFDPIVFPDYYTESASVWSDAWNFLFVPLATTNFINAAVTVTILLYNFEHFSAAFASADKEGEKITLKTFTDSGLLRRLLGTILISAAVPIILLSIFLYQANLSSTDGSAGSSAILTQLGFTIGLTLVFIVSNAGLMAQSLSKPLLRLTDAAKVIEDGKLTVKEAKDLGKKVEGDDEVAQLSRIFYRMAQEVIQREQKLIRQVRKLKIEINESKQQEEISEIVDTDFFKELQAKAKKVKDGRKK